MPAEVIEPDTNSALLTFAIRRTRRRGGLHRWRERCSVLSLDAVTSPSVKHARDGRNQPAAGRGGGGGGRNGIEKTQDTIRMMELVLDGCVPFLVVTGIVRNVIISARRAEIQNLQRRASHS
jgi:hypothetical protein